MNYTIDSSYRFQDFINTSPGPEGSPDMTKPVNKKEFSDASAKEVKQEIQKIRENMMMDAGEVKNFLFMLIGAEIQVKPENSMSGAYFNSLA